MLGWALQRVTGERKHDRVPRALRPLHQLPVRYREDLNILPLAHKSWNSWSPSYISALLTEQQPIRSLRSSIRDSLRLSGRSGSLCSASWTVGWVSSRPPPSFLLIPHSFTHMNAFIWYRTASEQAGALNFSYSVCCVFLDFVLDSCGLSLSLSLACL